MQVGFIGLGKMGGLMVERLLKDGHEVVVFDLSPEAVAQAQQHGAKPAGSVPEMVEQLQAPRVVWMMVPHGDPVDAVLHEALPKLSTGDVIIDGGNSHYVDSVRRATECAQTGVEFMDVGTSGGLEGAHNGACLMIGGTETAFAVAEPLFKSLAMEDGYNYMGPSGAGHYVKMVHNGVEYAMVQAYGEGFEMLKNSPYQLNLEQVAKNWNHGSIVRSFVLGLAEKAFAQDPDLSTITDEVGGGSTGEWTVQASIDSKTAIPSIYTALAARYNTRYPESFAAKVVAALRNQWGGHEVAKK